MVSWEYLWPTLRCKREAGVSPLLSISWWYLSSESPKRHCCRVSAADKGCRVYPLDPHPDTVALYSGCTSGKRPTYGKSSVAPVVFQRVFAYHRRSGDLLIETISALQTKSFLLAKTFIDSNLTVTPHKSLNSYRGVISEPDLLYASEGEILEGLSDQGVTQRSPKILVVPQTSHTYAQVAKSSNKTSSTQTDENITKIKCPPLELLQPLSSTTRTNLSISTPDVSTSSSSTLAQLLPSTFSISSSNSESQPPIPTCNDAPSNNMVLVEYVVNARENLGSSMCLQSHRQLPANSYGERSKQRMAFIGNLTFRYWKLLLLCFRHL
ncbi:uncharacterized protein TNCV_2796791 [Trichonephila clavipes]|nr:uncharacterized protein TNCV_2796791 [Trichonephila clavipes]